jgi:hypothetical protein
VQCHLANGCEAIRASEKSLILLPQSSRLL